MTRLRFSQPWVGIRHWRQFHRSTLAWVVAAMAALMVIVVTETTYNDSTDALIQLSDRATARQEARVLMGHLRDAETEQRGYLLTDRTTYLEPYQKSVAQVGTVVSKLRQLYDDEPKMRPVLQKIEIHVQQKLAEMASTLELHAQGRHAQWRDALASDQGQASMDMLRNLLGSVVEFETERIDAQRSTLFGMFNFNRAVVILMVGLTLLAVVLFLRESQLRGRAHDEHAADLRAERDQLEGEVARRTDELRELAQHLQNVREDERGHLARELHDELGGLLTAAKMDSARLRRHLGPDLNASAERILRHLNGTVDQVITLKRRIIEDLRPSTLSNLGLLAAVQLQVKEFRDHAEMNMNDLLEPVSLTPRAQMTVYRVIQESLTNIAKHAQATDVTVSLGNEGNRVLLSIEDNGCGFDTTQVKPMSHGLTGMRYRVEAEGGTVAIQSLPGQGTRLSVSLPSVLLSNAVAQPTAEAA